MVNSPVIAAPVSRSIAGRVDAHSGAGQAIYGGFAYNGIPSEGADQAIYGGFAYNGIPSEGADQAIYGGVSWAGMPSEGADQAYLGFTMPADGASL
jgi:hypothetical protein